MEDQMTHIFYVYKYDLKNGASLLITGRCTSRDDPLIKNFLTDAFSTMYRPEEFDVEKLIKIYQFENENQSYINSVSSICSELCKVATMRIKSKNFTINEFESYSASKNILKAIKRTCI